MKMSVSKKIINDVLTPSISNEIIDIFTPKVPFGQHLQPENARVQNGTLFHDRQKKKNTKYAS